MPEYRRGRRPYHQSDSILIPTILRDSMRPIHYPMKGVEKFPYQAAYSDQELQSPNQNLLQLRTASSDSSSL
uniref:Uncharacterized protein n=1 Tax=Tanacetum cinerariifolium TaxID=118510 RepID=A0A699QFT1_TANCI|nr:hypothetical protein [Tanacetum cinerariifolium]